MPCPSRIGTKTCGEFASDYRVSPREVETGYFTWAQGLMSGMNLASVANVGRAKDLGGRTLAEEKSFKVACRRLAEAGCTTPEIMAVSGHRTLAQVQVYVDAFDRAQAANPAIMKLTKPRQGVK